LSHQGLSGEHHGSAAEQFSQRPAPTRLRRHGAGGFASSTGVTWCRRSVRTAGACPRYAAAAAGRCRTATAADVIFNLTRVLRMPGTPTRRASWWIRRAGLPRLRGDRGTRARGVRPIGRPRAAARTSTTTVPGGGRPPRPSPAAGATPIRRLSWPGRHDHRPS
jgi:hypothetical protein